jgi:putative ABC transport system permease protein
MFTELARRLLMLFRRRQFDADLDEEMRLHRELREREEIERGLSPKEAHYAAQRRFGNDLVLREESRDMWGWNWLENLMQDIRFGLRMFLKSPGFAGLAILILALGVGADTAVFSALDATLLRPLPYPSPRQLVMVWGVDALGCCRHGGLVFSAPNFLEFKEENRVFKNVGTFDGAGFTLTGVASPEHLRAGRVTSDFFQVLAVRPMLGRTFLPEDDMAGRDHVTLLSYGLWQRRFGSDPQILGQTIRLDAVPYTVVGVLPRDFDFSIPGYYGPRDLWVPAVLTRDNSERAHNYLNVIARLKPGVTARQAQADLNAVAAQLRREYSTSSGQAWGAAPEMEEHSGVIAGAKTEPLHDEIYGDIAPLLWILFGAVGFVLLIACANVANLQLARASAREKEIAVRVTLGAGRLRVIRQLLTESVLLALLGGGLGLLLAVGGVRVLSGLQPAGLPRSTTLSINVVVLVYSLVLSLVTGLLFGLAPALHSWGSLDVSLRQGGRMSTSGANRSRLRNLLMVSEVALSAVLLIGAGLLVRSFVKLLAVKPGFEIGGIQTLPLNLPKYSYPNAWQQAAFYRGLLERVGTLPGVKAVGVINDLPLSSDSDSDSFNIEGRAPADGSRHTGSSQDRLASPGYFRAMGIPLIAGRTFTEADASAAPPVVVVSASFAHRFFPSANPLGQRLTFGETGPWATIVGVVGDVRDLGLDADPDIDIYAPYQQSVLPYNPLNYMTLVIRAEGDPRSLAAGVLNTLHGLDKDLPLPAPESMAAVYAGSLEERRFDLLLLGTSAAIGVILAAVGIYGVISYSTAQRTHEVGIRMALGATTQDVLLQVVGRGLLLTTMGVAMGLAGALALARVLRNMLFGVTASDPATFAGVSLLLIAIAALACYVPARRATKVDPMVALRYE